MRQTTFKILNVADSVATYPDEMCFAYNPNFIEIKSACSFAALNVNVCLSGLGGARGSHEIAVSLCNGACKVYLSRLFELLFFDPQNFRSIVAQVSVFAKDSLLFEFSTVVIWGNLAVGERFGLFGAYEFNANKKYFERNVIWFKSYPFDISIFKPFSNLNIYGRYDDKPYSQTTLESSCSSIALFHEIDSFSSELPPLSLKILSNAAYIIYYEKLHCFIAKDNDVYYLQWTSNANKYILASGYMMTSVANGYEPLPTQDYVLAGNETEEWIYHWNGENLVKMRPYIDCGMVDLNVESLFPDACFKATLKYAMSDEIHNSVFDKTFDYTFSQLGIDVALINLRICNDTTGYYLRWIDRQGYRQYFLFIKGDTDYKNKLSSDVVLQDKLINDLYFANITRTRKVECTVTYKCCAVNLPPDIYAYVSTILTAPIIDLYCGKDINGDEIWLPVNIQAGTVKYLPKQTLNDLEFSFAIPDANSQSL